MKKADCAVAALIFCLCFAITAAVAGDPPKLVGLALPEAGTDKGWNEQGKLGLEIVARKYGFKIELAEALGYGDIKPILRDMVRKGCELIICHASGYQTVAPEIARQATANHVRDFLDCVRSRNQPRSNYLAACQAHIACHSAYIAFQLGRSLTFDPATDTFSGDEAANRMRSRAMREPWRL